MFPKEYQVPFNKAAAATSQRAESTVGGVPFARDVDRYLWTLDDGPSLDKEVSEALAPIADRIICDFFIHNVANKTLHCMKAYVEATANQGAV